MKDVRYVDISIAGEGDLVWAGHDLGPSVGILSPGSTEYEFWRTIRKPHLPALAEAMGVSIGALPSAVRERFTSDVELQRFAEGLGIPTEFYSWVSTNWDD